MRTPDAGNGRRSQFFSKSTAPNRDAMAPQHLHGAVALHADGKGMIISPWGKAPCLSTFHDMTRLYRPASSGVPDSFAAACNHFDNGRPLSDDNSRAAVPD